MVRRCCQSRWEHTRRFRQRPKGRRNIPATRRVPLGQRGATLLDTALPERKTNPVAPWMAHPSCAVRGVRERYFFDSMLHASRVAHALYLACCYHRIERGTTDATI